MANSKNKNTKTNKDVKEVLDEQLDNDTKKNVDENVDEEVTKENTCDMNCESCSEDCFNDDDFIFEPIHKKVTLANIFSIVCKVIGVIVLLVGSYLYIKSGISYYTEQGTLPFVDICYTILTDTFECAFVFFGIGVLVDLVNRIKESIMY